MVVIGDTNPIACTLGSRIANAAASTSAFLLGANSSATLDFTAFPNMRLSAFQFTAGSTPSAPAQATTFTGTIIPANGTYMFGGGEVTLIGTVSAAGTLVLAGKNQLTGTNSVNIADGYTTITGSNNYSGGTTLNGNGISTVRIGIGSNSAFGTGTITFAGSEEYFFGAVNGDHSVSNNISFGTSTATWEAGTDQGTGGILANTSQEPSATSEPSTGEAGPIPTS